MKWLSFPLWDYGMPMIIATLLFCIAGIIISYHKQIKHFIVMRYKWIRAYITASKLTFKQRRNMTPAERKIERLSNKMDKIRKKRDNLFTERLEEHLAQLFNEETNKR